MSIAERCPVILRWAVLLLPLLSSGPARGGPPNILLIMADDMNWRDCGPYFDLPGGIARSAMPGDLTPHMDALAGQGMRFNHCFTATGMCAPLRQQLYTGIYPVRNGAYPNHGEVKAGTKSIVHHLQAIGYRVGIMGKRHIGPTASFPFEILGSGTDTEDAANIAAADAFINRDPDEPYCLVVTSHNPHKSWTHGDYVADPATLPVPDDYVDTPEHRQEYNKYLGEVNAFDTEVGDWMTRVDNGPDPGNTIFICLTEQGSPLPSAKWTCYDLGVRTGCLVRWPDRVAANSTTDALVELVDILPTLVDAVGGAVPTNLERFDGLGFLPVLLGQKPTHKQFVYAVQTSKEVNGQPDTGYAVRAIRDDRYKLIWNLQHTEVFSAGAATSEPFLSWQVLADDAGADPAVRAHAQLVVDRLVNRPPYQFFDLLADPFELQNLIDAPQHAGRIDDMREQLERWMRWQRDKGVPTELAADKGSFPVADEVHPFDAWANLHPFVWMADRAPSANPDGDDDDNFHEWIKGTDPLVADNTPGFLQVRTTPDGAGHHVDLTFPRPRHHAGFALKYSIESSVALTSGSWSPASSAPEGFAQPGPDDYLERATLRVIEPPATPRRFYSLHVTGLSDYPGAPVSYFSGTSSPVSIGAVQPVLNEKDLTITVRAQLPPGPVDDGSGNDRAEVLWELGAGNGMSLVVLGSDLVFSASANTSAGGAVTLITPLDPTDFGKPMTVRVSIDHKVSSTDFQLSGIVVGGSTISSDVILRQSTGYVGTNTAGIGDMFGSKITGISGTPFGPLGSLANGLADVSAWSSGISAYEIVGTVAAPIR